VVNRRAFEALTQKRAIDYIKSQNIEYFIDWQFNKDFILRESANAKPDSLIPLYQITAFESWRNEWYVYRVNKD
jgi:hypothetical protein